MPSAGLRQELLIRCAYIRKLARSDRFSHHNGHAGETIQYSYHPEGRIRYRSGTRGGSGYVMDITSPLIVLPARIVETSMETIRTVNISTRHTFLACGVRLVKVGIWLISSGLVLTNLQNIPAILSYIAGYRIGTLPGIEHTPFVQESPEPQSPAVLHADPGPLPPVDPDPGEVTCPGLCCG